MKTVKVHGKALECLRSFEIEEDRSLLRGDFPCEIPRMDSLNKKEERKYYEESK